MNTVKRLKNGLDRILLAVTMLMLAVMVADVSWQVIARYAMDEPSTFTDELARFLMVWVALLGGAYLFGRHGHLSVTLLRDRLPAPVQKILIVATEVLIIAFAAVVMIYGSQRLIGRTLAQPSPALGIPMGWVYSILPLSAGCIIFYSILNLAEFILGGGTTGMPSREGR